MSNHNSYQKRVGPVRALASLAFSIGMTQCGLAAENTIYSFSELQKDYLHSGSFVQNMFNELPDKTILFGAPGGIQHLYFEQEGMGAYYDGTAPTEMFWTEEESYLGAAWACPISIEFSCFSLFKRSDGTILAVFRNKAVDGYWFREVQIEDGPSPPIAELFDSYGWEDEDEIEVAQSDPESSAGNLETPPDADAERYKRYADATGITATNKASQSMAEVSAASGVDPAIVERAAGFIMMRENIDMCLSQGLIEPNFLDLAVEAERRFYSELAIELPEQSVKEAGRIGTDHLKSMWMMFDTVARARVCENLKTGVQAIYLGLM